ncbi:MAG: hypothetical protein H6945_14550 [Zoogloeaceae bacterium]|nr:hypothetical protein [Rhodocyclaceae bacterium]MCP5236952.1 hypothetical protein [Zoogloeaceae bacterium]
MDCKLPTLCLCLTLAACAYRPPLLTLRAGQATEAEVMATAGAPTRRWQDADGGSTLEYTTQPWGTVCWMVKLDVGGRLIGVSDALSLDNRLKIEPGMDKAEVSRRLGVHRSVEYFVLSDEEVWDWNIENTGPGIETRFNVHFRDGVVLRTSQSYIYPRDGGFDL